MRASEIFTQQKEEIKKIAGKYGVKRIGLFGSTAQSIDRENSDFDFYVEIDSFWELCGLQCELQELLKKRVDVVAPGLYRSDEIARNAKREMELL